MFVQRRGSLPFPGFEINLVNELLELTPEKGLCLSYIQWHFSLPLLETQNSGVREYFG